MNSLSQLVLCFTLSPVSRPCTKVSRKHPFQSRSSIQAWAPDGSEKSLRRSWSPDPLEGRNSGWRPCLHSEPFICFHLLFLCKYKPWGNPGLGGRICLSEVCVCAPDLGYVALCSFASTYLSVGFCALCHDLTCVGVCVACVFHIALLLSGSSCF